MESKCENCYCCGKLLSGVAEKKRRRLLSNPALKNLVQTLSALISEVCSIVDTDKLQTGYACRGCVVLLEKYQELRRQLSSNLGDAIPTLPKVTTAGSASSVVLAPLGASMPTPTTSQGPIPVVSDTICRSPAMTTQIHYRSRSRLYNITPSRRRICKPLVRMNYNSFASQCIKRNTSTKAAIIKVVGQLLHSELAVITSDKFQSITRQKSKESVQDFKHIKNCLLNEMKRKAPTILSLLRWCLKTRKPRPNSDTIVIFIFSVLCKHRRPSANLVQRIISMILYTGHSSKQVYQRLQKVGICMSHSATTKLVSHLGGGFDNAVLQWKKDAENNLQVDATAVTHGDTSLLLSPYLSPHVTPTIAPTLTSTPIIGGSGSALTPFSFDSEVSSKASNISPDSSMSFTCDVSTLSNNASPILSDCSLSLQPSDAGDSADICGESTLSVESSDTCNLAKSVNSGFKLVFDNIDKTVKPRHMREDSQAKSLHYVHAYAVKDRIDYSCIRGQRVSEINLYDILPSFEDYTLLKENFTVHISRLVVSHLDFFMEDFKELTQKHILHKYSREMCRKSEVVPIGVLPKNETKYEEMIDILEEYKKYLPSTPILLEEPIPGTNETQDCSYVTTLVGGDYLSVSRARGAQCIRGNSELEMHRLSGMLPVAEDWHAKVCLLEVLWKRLYKTSSGMEKGTLYQLRNLLNRRNVSKSPKHDVNASEDFLEVVITGHILSAVMTYLGMSSIHDTPSPCIVSPDVWMEDKVVRQTILADISTYIVDKYIDLGTVFNTHPPNQSVGTVHDYACEVTSLGLLLLEFKDAVREGDGDRILLLWKYLMVLFKASGRKNYAIEALTLLTQYHFILPANIAAQVKWSRFINTSGIPGHNISCDLHMEHLNRLVKVAIDGLGANKSEKAIMRAGKAIGILCKATESYDTEVGVRAPSGKHSMKSQKDDINRVVEQLLECNVFDSATQSTHKSFVHLKTNLIKTLDEERLKEWILERFSFTSCIITPPPIHSDVEETDCTDDSE